MQHIIKNRTEAILLALDAETAFDSVRWDYLYRTLFKFHEKFIKTRQALYTKSTARIKINGSLSDSTRLERGCRQGCSASPLLFAIFFRAIKPMDKAK